MVRMALTSSPSQTRRPRLALSLTSNPSSQSSSSSSSSSSSYSSAPVSAQSSWVSYSSSALGTLSAPSSSSSLGQISSLSRTTPSQLLRQNAFQTFPSKAQQQARKRLPPFLRQNAHPDLLAFCEMLYPPSSPSSPSSSASSPRSPDFGGDFPSPRSAKSSPSSSPCSSPRNNPSPIAAGLSPRTKSTPPSPRVSSPRVSSPRLSSPRNGSPSALSALSASSLDTSQPELVYSCNITEYETILEAETPLDVARQVLAMNHQLYKMAGGVMSFDLSTLKEIPPASSSDKRSFTFNVKWVLPMDAFRSGNLECDPNEIANWLQESVPQRSTRLCDFRDLDLSLIRKTLRQAIETLENPPSK